MNHVSCPTSVIKAPVDIVWALLMHPEAWGEFYDIRVLAVDPAGPATVGQRIIAESGPRVFHFKLELRFTRIDALNREMGLSVRLPLGIRVEENLVCVPLGDDQCRVSYNCDFRFPQGWRGTLARLILRRELETGPADSLNRLRRAAEDRFAGHGTPESPR